MSAWMKDIATAAAEDARDRLITDADAWEISDPVTKDLRPEMRNA
jgi:hypothetical protein